MFLIELTQKLQLHSLLLFMFVKQNWVSQWNFFSWGNQSIAIFYVPIYLGLSYIPKGRHFQAIYAYDYTPFHAT